MSYSLIIKLIAQQVHLAVGALPLGTAIVQQRLACMKRPPSWRDWTRKPWDRSESLLREGSDTGKNQLPYKSAGRRSLERAFAERVASCVPEMPDRMKGDTTADTNTTGDVPYRLTLNSMCMCMCVNAATQAPEVQAARKWL